MAKEKTKNHSSKNSLLVKVGFLFDFEYLCGTIKKNQIMKQQLLILPTARYRISLFLEKIKNENKLFDCSLSANKHMRDCLNEVEEENAPQGRMSLIALKHFNQLEQYKLYFHRTPAHFVVIHKKGAYAIFEKNRDSLQDKNLFYYRKQNPIIEFKSLTGTGIWEDFDIVVHHNNSQE